MKNQSEFEREFCQTLGEPDYIRGHKQNPQAAERFATRVAGVFATCVNFCGEYHRCRFSVELSS